MTLETTIKYIQKISTLLSEDGGNNATFKIIYELRDICAQLEDSSIIKLPKKLTAASTICHYCHTRWDTGNFRPVLKPVKRKKSFTKLLSKDPSSLNAYQRKFLDNCNKDNQNTMMLKCLKCSRTTKIKLRRALTCQEVVQVESIEAEIKKKKKRKRKDLFFGLNHLFVSDRVKKVRKENTVESQGRRVCESLTEVCAEGGVHRSTGEQALVDPGSTEILKEQVSSALNQKKYISSKEKNKGVNKSIQGFSKKSNIIQPNGSVKKKKAKKHKMKERKKEFFSGKLSNKKTSLLLDEILRY